jgi:hypothetical protein
VPLRWTGRLALLVLLVVGVVACGRSPSVDGAGSAAGSTGAPVIMDPGPSVGGAGPAAGSTNPALPTEPSSSVDPVASAPAGAVQLSEADRGRTVPVRVGDEVTVVLHQTYWSMAPPSPSGPVRQTAATAVAPQLHGCVPGGGCGTVTTSYVAAAPGSVTIAAHRQTCGEAKACAPDQRDWQVVVAVS